MSDYLGAPVIIQRDLNLPATLWFDGSAHSFGVGFSHVKHRQIMIGLSVAFTKSKHARYGCDTHVGAVASRSSSLILLDIERGNVHFIVVRVDTEEKTMSQMVNPYHDEACRPPLCSSLLRLINQSQHKCTCAHTQIGYTSQCG